MIDHDRKRCAYCGKEFGSRGVRGGSIRLQGRGLCGNCYKRLARARSLDAYPSTIRKLRRTEVLNAWEDLSALGYDWRRCAAHLGMKYFSFERAMFRARKAGDPRAVRG